ncbi:DNA gyrase inhibitor YacG [Lichenibacterium minor]|jgi:hypothetical protein|uniref:DNA gyrase inhibitor YacG n=1 Tax=Lichenibacterium minor TaxID=2316528 RepID=A0A4Q2UCU9_9HYPH|nr:DNA gyrase inhibitor YacG [Lichenibacterium minor]RYC32936.1 DNA gyrase inhibitor YacG [Lichenibacterium minor]
MDEAANDNSGPAVKRRCPICSRAASPEFKPFCSKRCADVDLHRWLGEGYRVPVALDDDMRDSPDPE